MPRFLRRFRLCETVELTYYILLRSIVSSSAASTSVGRQQSVDDGLVFALGNMGSSTSASAAVAMAAAARKSPETVDAAAAAAAGAGMTGPLSASPKGGDITL